MLAKVTWCAVIGLDGQLVDVEVDIGSGQVLFLVVGLVQRGAIPEMGLKHSRQWQPQTKLPGSACDEFPKGGGTITADYGDKRRCAQKK